MTPTTTIDPAVMARAQAEHAEDVDNLGFCLTCEGVIERHIDDAERPANLVPFTCSSCKEPKHRIVDECRDGCRYQRQWPKPDQCRYCCPEWWE